MKASGKFFIAFGIIFIVMFLLEYNQDEPIDWSPGFNKVEKKPFGEFLLFEALPGIFKSQKIVTVNSSIVDRLNENERRTTNVNYIFINDNVSINEYETNALLDFVHNGNNVFIASGHFSDTLLHSVALREKSFYDDAFIFS